MGVRRAVGPKSLVGTDRGGIVGVGEAQPESFTEAGLPLPENGNVRVLGTHLQRPGGQLQGGDHQQGVPQVLIISSRCWGTGRFNGGSVCTTMNCLTLAYHAAPFKCTWPGSLLNLNEQSWSLDVVPCQ